MEIRMRMLLLTLLACPLVFAADTPLGQPLALKERVALERLMANPAAYAGKAVQVRGKITAVCEDMGCWMALTTSDTTVRVKVNDGEIVFPKEAIGKLATAEGKFVKTGSSWQIQGSGAVIHE